MPGQPPELVYKEDHRMLFADDHVLAKISLNPLIDFTFGESESSSGRSSRTRAVPTSARLRAV